MRPSYNCLFITLVITSCSNDPHHTIDSQPAQTATVVEQKPTPPALEEKFDMVIEEYEGRITNGFWSEFNATTRRGGKGPTEITFDATAFENFMTKKGFHKIPNTFMDYTGTINGIEVSVMDRGATSGERGGWVHHWAIETKAATDSGTFEKSKNFTTGN